ncbi:histidine ammonia-lyase-like [Rhopilema esculentum]|uniref:histidine ammonia-lyase-like n=1 Tax=Rhopilema esculentum TaxID=499914 RepID=UPI0031E0D022|eukprot:gene2390-18034_t
MKLFVKVDDGQWNALPCGDGESKVGWIASEMKTRLCLEADAVDLKCHVRTKNGESCLLNASDRIRDVLENNDFVQIVSKTVQNGAVSSGDGEDDMASNKTNETVKLDGNSLTTEQLVRIGKGSVKIELTEEAWNHVKKSRALLDQIVIENKVVYGVTTGFGKFAHVVVPKEKLERLQENLIRSHACGVGKPLTIERTRMLLALRINILSKGYSGVSVDTLSNMINMLNASCLPLVPEQGTVGASGDLAPLAHLALGAMGEGKMWSPKSGWADAKDVLESHNLKTISLRPKEGLALINGTQLIASLGSEALERAAAIARQADVIASLSLEVLKGSTKAFHPLIHEARPHPGQGLVAKSMRALLHSDVFPSEIAESHRFCHKVQDAYTLRCCPQVHGITRDTIEFVKKILTTELNSATDNPMVFAEIGETMSGGNFHGEYPAKALDYLAIAVHELANIAERRTNRLMNPAYSELPAFLVEDGGFNSGFMMAHVTSAALVSENKGLCHPASVDSLTTSAGTEDHVSMGGWAARKALSVVENVERVMAIELMAACQGIEFLRPLKTTEPLEAVYKVVRATCKKLDGDRYMAEDIENITQLLRSEKIWKTVVPFIERYNKQIFVGDGAEPLNSPTSSSIQQEPITKRQKFN